MKNFRIILLFIICLNSHLSYAGPISRFFNEKILKFLQSTEAKFIAKTFVPTDNFNENYANLFSPGKISPNVASFHTYKYLNLLSEEELISRMQKIASELNIQPLSTENWISNVDLFVFNLFLELESSGTDSQRALVKAIIRFAQLRHFKASLKFPSLKDEKAKVYIDHWIKLEGNLSEEDIDVQRRWFYKITSEILKDSSMSAFMAKQTEASLHIDKALDLLSEEELLSRMREKSSELNVQPLTIESQIETFELFYFNRFLELESSGTRSQQALAKAIIRLAQIEHYLAGLKVPSSKDQKAKVNYHHWMMLAQSLTEEEINVQTIFIHKITSELLEASSLSDFVTE